MPLYQSQACLDQPDHHKKNQELLRRIQQLQLCLQASFTSRTMKLHNYFDEISDIRASILVVMPQVQQGDFLDSEDK
jgi:hypothetical protein